MNPMIQFNTMQHPRPKPNHRLANSSEHGATLIELMVGITIGLLTVTVGLGALMVSRGISGTVSEASSLQQQAAYAFRVMGQQIRQAGSLELSLNPNFSSSTTVGVSAALTPVAFDAPNPENPQSFFDRATSTLQGNDGTGSTPYSFTMKYQNYKENIYNSTSGTVSSAQFRDCLGENPNPINPLVTSQFTLKKISGQPDTNQELVCTGIDNNQQSIIQNIADMRVRYLVQDPGSAASGIPKMNYALASVIESSPRRWADVYAVEVCLELVGSERIDTVGNEYTKCDGSAVTRDNRLRMVFKNIFQIRSQGQPAI